MSTDKYQLTPEQIDELMGKQPMLQKQTYEDIDTIDALSPQVISRQATLNIGTIGHVAHGKSTLVRAISGINTVKFQKEKVNNITIKLGYANAKIYKSDAPAPDCYKAYPSNTKDEPICPITNKPMKLVRQVSFVDCPGHDILMSTMLTGAAVMDAAILLVAGNMPCPQPQTYEHLRAIQIMDLKNIIIVQNKVDIIFKDQAKPVENFEQIKKFIKDFVNQTPPIIPCSAQLKYNVDAVIQNIVEYFPVPQRDLKSPPVLSIIRSFDVNKAGNDYQNLKGGVVGGSIIQGVLKVGDEIEIRPGQIEKKDGKVINVTPIKSRVVSLFAEQNDLLYAVPGGLIGVGLLLDPSLTRNDRLVGNVLGYANHLPEICTVIEIKFFLMRRLVIRQESKQIQIQKIQTNETIKFNIGSTQTLGRVQEVNTKNNSMVVELINPVCCELGQKAAFCRKMDNKFRLIGWGDITKCSAWNAQN